MNESLRRNNDVDWDTFNAQTYRERYFTELGAEDLWVATETLAFLAEREVTADTLERVADVGTGPSLVLPLAGVAYAKHVELIEPGAQNAAYLRRVLQETQDMYQDWNVIEQQIAADAHALPAHAHAARLLMERAVVRQAKLGDLAPDTYDMVTSCFCAESATGDVKECSDMIQTMLGSLKKDGIFAVGYIEHSQGYPDYTHEENGINPRKFPAVDIDKQWLERQFRGNNITVSRCPYSQEMRDGYSGVLLAIGTK
ncbi:MAG: hypothetical protein ACQR33_02180 [Candidatus Saccharibacteria bacterium]